jgi:hypothetical protein
MENGEQGVKGTHRKPYFSSITTLLRSFTRGAAQVYLWLAVLVMGFNPLLARFLLESLELTHRSLGLFFVVILCTALVLNMGLLGS